MAQGTIRVEHVLVQHIDMIYVGCGRGKLVFVLFLLLLLFVVPSFGNFHFSVSIIRGLRTKPWRCILALAPTPAAATLIYCCAFA